MSREREHAVPGKGSAMGRHSRTRVWGVIFALAAVAVQGPGVEVIAMVAEGVVTSEKVAFGQKLVEHRERRHLVGV